MSAEKEVLRGACLRLSGQAYCSGLGSTPSCSGFTTQVESLYNVPTRSRTYPKRFKEDKLLTIRRREVGAQNDQLDRHSIIITWSCGDQPRSWLCLWEKAP